MKLARFLAAAVVCVPAVGSLPAAAGPLDPTYDALAGDACDPIDPAECLLPFPNDHFTVADATTPTGRRVHIPHAAMPRALQGAKPVFADEVNRNDGFSPGSMILAHVPGLDLHESWDSADAEPPGHRDHIADIARYRQPDAPILLVNAETGERHPFWSELDLHPETPQGERLLILRPAVNLEENTRYLVALRELKNSAKRKIPAGSAFAAYRDGAGSDPERQAEVDRIISELAAAERGRGHRFDRNELHLAWEFTVASSESLAGRALHIRDDAFALLGDPDLGDGEVEGDAPDITIEQVEGGSGDTHAFVHGYLEVPNYLTHNVATRDAYDPTGRITSERLSPLYAPHARFYYPPGEELPAVNPLQRVAEVPFTCRIPSSALPGDEGLVDPAMPVLLGHGLLGQRYEVGWSSGHLLTRRHNAMYCATEWLGMALGDLPTVAATLADPSFFPSVADRSQQGFVNFLYLGRAMIHPEGLAAQPAFQAGKKSLIDTDELYYEGNSQGGIMGGALTALAPDFTKAVLGVPGMNYSTLLNRSVDWEGEYGEFYYASIPDPQQRQLGFALMQMLWDRAEANGYAHHMTTDPYPGTPAHQVLLHPAYGDYQVANVTAEVEARTIGARVLHTALAPGRHWSVDPLFGLEPFDVDEQGRPLPWRGSALVYWDSGNPAPPNGNLPPERLGQDPHRDPRGTPESGVQRARFFATGEVVDVFDGRPYCTHRFSRHAELSWACPEG